MPKQEEYIPIYLFLGFLESGKTKFIQETLEDRRFNKGERTLFLMCEEGIEELDLSKMPKKNIEIHLIEDKSELTEENLNAIVAEYKPERIIVEYNGMWNVNDFFDAMPDYDVSLYANKKQKTTPETAKEALEALLPVLSDEALDFADRDSVFNACKAKAEELGKKNGWLLYPLGIALSGKQRTPGGGTDLACMMGREKTLQRVQAAIAKLNG